MQTAAFFSRNSVHKVAVVLNRPREYSTRCSLMQVLKLLIKEQMKHIFFCEAQERRNHNAAEISIIFRFHKILNLLLYFQ